MNCKQVQDMLLTDYLDNQLSSEKRKKLQAHIARCKRCQEFAVRIKKTIQDPFSKVKLKVPSQKIWNDIKTEILQKQEEQTKNWFAKAREQVVYAVMTVSKPVLVTAMTVIIVITAFFALKSPVQNQQVVNEYLQKQITFVNSLDTETALADYESCLDLDTSIEIYLL